MLKIYFFALTDLCLLLLYVLVSL